MGGGGGGGSKLCPDKSDKRPPFILGLFLWNCPLPMTHINPNKGPSLFEDHISLISEKKGEEEKQALPW